MSFKPKSTKERIQHRLKIVQGHLKKVSSMIENDSYCIDIIHQSQAIQKALRELDNVILEEHLKTCVADSITRGEKDHAIHEVMQVFQKHT